MLKESMRLERKPAVLIIADFSGPNVEAYAMAWLVLTNNAREYPKKIYSIQNERNSSRVYVICNPKNADEIKDFLSGISTYYEADKEKIHYVGKVLDSCEIEVGVPVYEYESDADSDGEEWEDDMDASIMYWGKVEEKFG